MHLRGVCIRRRQVLTKARWIEHAPAEHDGAAGDRLVGGLVVQLRWFGQIGIGEGSQPEIHAA
eukprot:5176640-Prymnesium_polylepis.1